MSLERDINSLARVPFFSAMDHEALRLMAFAAENRDLPAGEVLFRKGDSGDGGFLVMSGAVDLDSSDHAGGLGARPATTGTLIGVHGLLAVVRRRQTATVREPSLVLAISRALFTRVLREYPTNAKTVRRLWARHLHEKLSNLKGSIRR